MKAIVVLLVLVAVAAAATPFLTEDLVSKINSIPGLTWKASAKNGIRVNGATKDELKALLGARMTAKPMLPARVFTEAELKDPIPDSFDAAEHWPDCPTLKEIRDQSACGSCWAIAAAEAMSDRYCIQQNIKSLRISTSHLMECCWACGQGCHGGHPYSAWSFWVSNGLFTEDCQPYPFPRCEHHIPQNHYPVCPATNPTPPCSAGACNGNSTDKPVKHYGAKAYSISGVEGYQRELMTSGPFEVSFTVYSDWMAYKSGVYTRTSSEVMGGHAVKVVGWGELDGVKYWKIANSWNEDWGMDGYFLIRRGTNECGIDYTGTAGTPKN